MRFAMASALRLPPGLRLNAASKRYVSGITSCSVLNRARSRRWIGLASLDLKIVPGRAVMLAANAVSTQTVN
jgi:hypothetical protein